MSRKTHALKLVRNVYGQKQAGRVWNKYMDQGIEIGFKPSSFDPCLYYQGSIIFLVYSDDCIIFGPDRPSIDAVVADLQVCSHRFTVDDQGDIGDFLGIQVQKFPDGTHTTYSTTTDWRNHQRPTSTERVKHKEDTCGAQQSPLQRHRQPGNDSRVPLSSRDR